MRIGLGLAITNNQKAGPPGDVTAPTVAITLSDYALKIGDTATATFTFSEAPTGFTEADVTAPNGSLSSFGVTGNPLIYTAIFTPTADVSDATNVITVGTGWTDAAGNPPAGSTTSDNYAVDTIAPTCTITCVQTSPSATTPLNFTFTFSESVTGFTLGDITVGNGSAGNFAGSGAIYTADITPTGMSVVTVDVAGSVCQDAAGNNNSAATQFTFTSTAPFSDAFTRADGAIGSVWTGATWTIASNAALNTPTVGSEMHTSANAASDPNGNEANATTGWGITGGTFTSDSSAPQTGTYSLKLSSAFDDRMEFYPTYTLGTWYAHKLYAKYSGFQAGSLNGWTNLSTALSNETLTTSWVNYIISGRATATGEAVIRIYCPYNGVETSAAEVDNYSLKPLTFASLFATLPSVDVASVTAQVLVTVNPNFSQAGHIINLDSISSPANFVLAYLAGDGTAKLDKCVAGVYTNLISGSVTFGAAKVLKVVKNGNTYQLWYDGIQVGTDQTIASMNGTIHGLFSTSSTPKFDTYQLSATP